ncbi:MAG: hypothetical protein ACI9P7_000581 [Candidatus Azotimanducaceae bacterium]|jgi:hypothetical protein
MRIYLTLMLYVFLPFPVLAQEVVLSDDGREVRLSDDGTWEFLSNDRFATTQNGERIRLLEDGSWQVDEGEDKWVAIATSALRLSKDTATTDLASIRLREVTIESARETQQKNTRLRSQIIFALELSSTDAGGEYQPKVEHFRISDSRGRHYPVKRLRPALLGLSPGETQTLTLVADGSPRWWGVKFFRLEVISGELMGNESVSLTKSMAEVVRSEVKSLSYE